MRDKSNPNVLLDTIKREKSSDLKGGIYHKIQVVLT